MKVVHLFWGFAVGGVENMLADIIARQVKSAEVHLVAINDQIDRNLLGRVDPHCRVYLLNRRIGSKNPLFILKLNRLLWHIRPDIVHYHASELRRLVLVPAVSVATTHNTNLPTTCYSRMDALVAISEAVSDDIRKQGDFSPIVIKNGIDVEQIKKRTKTLSAPFRLVQVGRLLIEQKGQDILIKALEQLVVREGFCDIQLDFIGDGPSRADLERMVSDCGLGAYVRFRGECDRSYVYEHLKDYDLFVQPSRFEGFGLTVAEAMAACVPVLVSDNDGPMEIINNGQYGRCFKNMDALSCASCIKEIYLHYPVPERLQEARAHVQRYYSMDHLVAEYDAVYRKALAAR